MKRFWRAAVAIASIMLFRPSMWSQASVSCRQPTPVTDSKFEPGQVWSFQGRSFEPNATITILRIESLPKIGEIIHVRIDGIRLRNCAGGPEPNVVEHAPFTREAIERSASKLLRVVAVPSYEEGYDDWLRHCGGAYTLNVGAMVVADEIMFNSGNRCFKD